MRVFATMGNYGPCVLAKTHSCESHERRDLIDTYDVVFLKIACEIIKHKFSIEMNAFSLQIVNELCVGRQICARTDYRSVFNCTEPSEFF